MYRSYNPLPAANVAVDRLRVGEYYGHPLYAHKNAYYLHVKITNNCGISKTAVDKCAEGSSSGHQIYILCEFPIDNQLELSEFLWADPEDIQECSIENDRYCVSESLWEILDPWVEDSITAPEKKLSAARPAGTGRSVVDLVLAWLKDHPGSTNNQIAAGLGKGPNETSTTLFSLTKNGLARRERETEDNKHGPRVSWKYWAI